MATFNIVLDKRTKLKGGKYNLAIRMVNINDVMYINIQKMTEVSMTRRLITKSKTKRAESFWIPAMDTYQNVKGYFPN
jgi:hypothetical protein